MADRVADLELSLRRWSGDDYAVEARFLPASADAQLIAGPPPRVRLDPAGYGAALFADERLRAALVRASAESSGAALRLRLDADDDEIHTLRWETLADPEGGPPLATSERILLSRYLDSADLTPLARRPRGGLRALVAVAASYELLAETELYEATRTQLHLGQALLAGDPMQGASLFGQARETFQRLGAAAELAAVSALIAP